MEVVWRVTIIYIFVFFGLRVVGKREFGQMGPMELVTLMMIPEIVSSALNRNDPSLTNALTGTATLILLVFAVSVISHGHKKAEDIIEDTPTVLVQHGKLIETNLNKERVSPGQIYSVMHEAGLEELRQVKWAVLENDGNISIVPEDQYRVNPPPAHRSGPFG